MCNVRICKEEENYIESTMADCVLREVILKEPKWFVKKSKKNPNGILTEEIIEEILTHEFIHIVVGKLHGDVVSQALDNISLWIELKQKNKAKIVFGTKEKEEVIPQMFDEEGVKCQHCGEELF